MRLSKSALVLTMGLLCACSAPATHYELDFGDNPHHSDFVGSGSTTVIRTPATSWSWLMRVANETTLGSTYRSSFFIAFDLEGLPPGASVDKATLWMRKGVFQAEASQIPVAITNVRRTLRVIQCSHSNARGTVISKSKEVEDEESLWRTLEFDVGLMDRLKGSTAPDQIRVADMAEFPVSGQSGKTFRTLLRAWNASQVRTTSRFQSWDKFDVTEFVLQERVHDGTLTLHFDAAQDESNRVSWYPPNSKADYDPVLVVELSMPAQRSSQIADEIDALQELPAPSVLPTSTAEDARRSNDLDPFLDRLAIIDGLLEQGVISQAVHDSLRSDLLRNAGLVR